VWLVKRTLTAGRVSLLAAGGEVSGQATVERESFAKTSVALEAAWSHIDRRHCHTLNCANYKPNKDQLKKETKSKVGYDLSFDILPSYSPS
jgi:hypothetical protein